MEQSAYCGHILHNCIFSGHIRGTPHREAAAVVEGRPGRPSYVTDGFTADGLRLAVAPRFRAYPSCGNISEGYGYTVRHDLVRRRYRLGGRRLSAHVPHCTGCI